MKPLENKIILTFLRYAILVVVAIPNLWIFYKIFSPLTVNFTYYLFNLSLGATLFPERIILVSNSLSIELIDACIAGSAYYLLLILNLSTPKIRFLQRIYTILLSFFIFLAANVLRIFLLGYLALLNSPLFVFAHIFFWYFLSTIIIILIWFSEVKLFKIKEIPFYSDIKFFREILKPRNSKAKSKSRK